MAVRKVRTAIDFAMPEVLLAFVLLLVSAYFLVAAFVTRFPRPPWRWRRDLLDWKKPAVSGPRFGFFSCMGVTIGLGGFGFTIVGLNNDARVVLLGFVLLFLGGLFDHYDDPDQTSL